MPSRGWACRSKKSLSAVERDEEERERWRRRVKTLDPHRFVFVDECGTHTSMARLWARAPRGERAHGRVPRNRGRNTRLVASMTLRGMGEAAVAFEGATDAKAFEASVEHFLAPALSAGQVVVLDNLGAHKGERVRELVERRGCELWFLPAYSPDLNPIEEAFGKVKVLLSKAAARTREALVEAIASALSAVTPEEARGFFDHCGYPPTAQPS